LNVLNTVVTDIHYLKLLEIMSKKQKIKANDFLDVLHNMFGDRHEHIGDDWKPKKPKTINE